MKQNPKVLFLDTEISKNLYAKFPPKKPEYDGYINVIKDWWIICGAWKWANKKKIDYVYVLDTSNDRQVVEDICEVISDCDILIGHNIEAFDWKKLQARVIYHGLPPLKKPRMIDTMKMAKAIGEFTSFSLGYLTKYFKIAGKAENPGNSKWNDLLIYDLTKDRINFNKTVEEIVDYCLPDVLAAEALYYKLLPYAPDKFNVNFNLYSDGDLCPKCGGKDCLIKDGFRTTNAGKYQSYKCKSCGGYCQDSKAVKRTKRK